MESQNPLANRCVRYPANNCNLDRETLHAVYPLGGAQMKAELFKEMMAGFDEAVKHRRGQKARVRVLRFSSEVVALSVNGALRRLIQAGSRPLRRT